MGDNIRTKWHLLKDAVASGEICLSDSKNKFPLVSSIKDFDQAKFEALVLEAEKLPMFFVNREVVDILDEKTVVPSITAMAECDCLRLPFPAMLLEYEGPPLADSGKCPRHFLIVLERDKTTKVPFHYDFCVELISFLDDTVFVSPSIFFATWHNDNEIEKAGVHFKAIVAPYMKPGSLTSEKLSEETFSLDVPFIASALYISLLLMNTRGIVKELIEPTRLNKQRIARGAPTIPSHTVIRIGHVYAKSGQSEAFDHRRSPRPHVRRGHTREVWLGPRKDPSARKRKLVYIEPMLVSYDPSFEPLKKQPGYKVEW